MLKCASESHISPKDLAGNLLPFVTMTVKVNSEGDFVTDIHTELVSNPVSASYEIFNKSDMSLGTLAHDLRRSLDVDNDSDEDISKWCSEVTSIQVASEGSDDDGSLGTMFFQATSYKANAYTKLPESTKYEAIATSELRETEYANQHEILVEGGVIDSDETVKVPQTKGGDLVPAVVLNDDKHEGVPTFEEAKEILDEFVSDYFGEVEVTEEADMNDSDGETNDEPTEEESDSDSDSDEHWLMDVPGVGSKLFEDLKDHMVENHASVHHGEFQDAEAIREAEVIVSEEEAEERLADLYGEIPEGVYSVAKEEISEGNIGKAMTLISDFEDDE